MSDSEIDDLQNFEASRQQALYEKAGIGRNAFEPEELSDEEVMGLHSESDLDDESDNQEKYYEQDDETVQSKRDKTNKVLERNWGNTRDNYFGGEDDIGEEAGASEEEEEEALRSQQQELEDMGDEDFVDEDDLEGWKTGGKIDDLDAEESELAQGSKSIDPTSMTSDERRELLQEKFPAVRLSTQELSKFPKWEAELAEDEKTKPEELVQSGRVALATYKGMIYSFFALFTDRLVEGDFKGLTQLEEHPVNEALLSSRQLWLNYCDASDKPVSAPISLKSALKPATAASGASGAAGAAANLGKSHEADVSMDEHVDEFSDSNVSSGSSDSEGREIDDEDSSDDEFSISRPSTVPTKGISRSRKVVGDYDETADTIEEQARAKNKQSLRFYTSQIGKGDKAKQASYSGDDDLPYRERDFERRQRLMAEAKKRGEQKRDDFSDNDDDETTHDLSSAANSDDGALDSYNQAQNERSEAKAMKQQRHAEASEASRAGRLAEYLAANPDADKRAINYQIEKNKGSTKRRKKENRNARVKKRSRYEAAQKKLKGVRKVYTGQQGPYQGELSGIRKNSSHSSKFKN